MKRLLIALLLSTTLLASSASADGEVPTGMWLRNSQGELFILAKGILVPIAVLQVADDQLAGYQLSPLWIVTQNGESVPAQRPDWAAGPLGQSVAAAPAVSSGPTWQTVAKWSGKGSKTTEPFTISGSQWRIFTAVENDGKFNQLCMSAKRISDGRLGSNGCAEGAGGVTYGTAGINGTMQMEISGVNGGWSVTVEEMR